MSGRGTVAFDETRPYFETADGVGVTERFDLTLSENPYPPLPSVRRELERVMGRANRYPEFLPQRLPRVIANHVGVHPDQVVVGSGATGVAMQLMHALLRPGESILFARPTFDGYPIMAKMLDVRAIAVDLDPEGRQDLWSMVRAIDSRTRVVVLCRPHNPTGTLVSANEVAAFLAAVPRRVTVVLDEAYVEFLAGADVLDTVGLVRRHANLLVLRTFSKAYGLAGLRIGYAFAGFELANRVRRWQVPFGMGAVAVAAVSASYAAESEVRDRVARITAERERLRAALLRAGVHVPRSHANFLYLDGPDIASRLRVAGISVKAYPDGSARIAVGDSEASAAVLKALS
ncbi:MAG TPA: aminotransferase class I/II-fold pyridoxal phosphate-dependent enzyme [Aldersonia sp.]